MEGYFCFSNKESALKFLNMDVQILRTCKGTLRLNKFWTVKAIFTTPIWKWDETSLDRNNEIKRKLLFRWWERSFVIQVIFVLFLEQINLYWRISEAWARPIYGKLIQICTDILQKLNSFTYEIFGGWVFQKSVLLMPQKLKILKKNGWVFTEIGLCHVPENWNLEKFMDKFSRICQ